MHSLAGVRAHTPARRPPASPPSAAPIHQAVRDSEPGPPADGCDSWACCDLDNDDGQSGITRLVKIALTDFYPWSSKPAASAGMASKSIALSGSHDDGLAQYLFCVPSPPLE